MDLTTELNKIKEISKIATTKLLKEFSEYFKEKHGIVDDRIVLLVHYYDDGVFTSGEHINLEIFDEDFRELESYEISNRYHDVTVEDKYKHLIDKHADIISVEDIPCVQ